MLTSIGVKLSDAKIHWWRLGDLQHAIENSCRCGAETGEQPDADDDDEHSSLGAEYVGFDREHDGNVSVENKINICEI